MTFFDNNTGAFLARGLCAFGEDTCHLTEHFPPNTQDEVWLQFIGQKGMFLITRDKMIRRRPNQLQALRRHSVGAFFLLGKNLDRWGQIRQIIQAWPHIKDAASKSRPPFAFSVSSSGTKVERLPLE